MNSHKFLALDSQDLLKVDVHMIQYLAEQNHSKQGEEGRSVTDVHIFFVCVKHSVLPAVDT